MRGWDPRARARWLALWVAVLTMGSACRPTASDWQTVEVKRDELRIVVDVSGTIEAVDSARVGPPAVPGVWNYKIAMMVPEGEVVQEGQPILMFDTTDLTRRLDQKTAERDSAATELQLEEASAKVARQDEALALAEAQAELRKAKLDADAPADLVSTIEIDKSRLDLELAKEKIAYLQRKAASAQKRDGAEMKRWRSKRDRAQQRVEEITAAIERMRVPASRAGTVIHTTNWQGEKKKVGDNAWRGETIMQIASLDEMKAEGTVDEVDISKLEVGQTVSLRLDALADVELRGEIAELSRTVQRANPENPVKVVRLDIALQDEGGVKLRPGMRFQGEVETERIDDALLVPLRAVVPTDVGPVVRRVDAGGIESVEVTLGPRNSTYAAVTAGLDEGDEVVFSGEALR